MAEIWRRIKESLPGAKKKADRRAQKIRPERALSQTKPNTGFYQGDRYSFYDQDVDRD